MITNQMLYKLSDTLTMRLELSGPPGSRVLNGDKDCNFKMDSSLRFDFSLTICSSMLDEKGPAIAALMSGPGDFALVGVNEDRSVSVWVVDKSKMGESHIGLFERHAVQSLKAAKDLLSKAIVAEYWRKSDIWHRRVPAIHTD